MHLRHIDPHSTEWMDAMLDEGKGEAEAELEASMEDSPVLAAPLVKAAPKPAAQAGNAGPPR